MVGSAELEQSRLRTAQARAALVGRRGRPSALFDMELVTNAHVDDARDDDGCDGRCLDE